MNKTRNHSLKALCLSACLLGAPAAKGDTVQVIGNLTGTIN